MAGRGSSLRTCPSCGELAECGDSCRRVVIQCQRANRVSRGIAPTCRGNIMRGTGKVEQGATGGREGVWIRLVAAVTRAVVVAERNWPREKIRPGLAQHQTSS